MRHSKGGSGSSICERMSAGVATTAPASCSYSARARMRSRINSASAEVANRIVGVIRIPRYEAPSRTIDSVNRAHRAEQFGLPLGLFANPQRDADRSGIVRMNQADDVLQVQYGESVFQRRFCAFGGKAVAPSLTDERPRHLQSGPSLRIEQPDSPDELARRFLLDRPQSITAQLPMAEVRGHREPGLRASLGLAVAEIFHHLGVGVERRERFEVARQELPH